MSVLVCILELDHICVLFESVHVVCVCASDTKWRNPDLREVIDYLSHEDDLIKANAAAYLQHLTYMDDNIKAETRSTDSVLSESMLCAQFAKKSTQMNLLNYYDYHFMVILQTT